ncbi:MAG TPA: hypothetical protein VGI08_10840 [Diaminobutyricibacter sp.]
MHDLALAVSVFLACVVEAVEATTIVLAVGSTRNWRSTMTGVAAALVVLAAAVLVFGPAILLLPIGILRLVVGGVLLVFGLSWIRKAVLRASGRKALHDEDAIFQKQIAAAARAERTTRGVVKDWYAFTLAFKGVLLEGLEVVLIVLTFGANENNLSLAVLAAVAAVVLVVILGLIVRGPLSRVPENTLKFVVGIMLTGFGTFWGGEGAGATWPGDDLALLVIIPAVALCALGMVWWMRSRRPAKAPGGPGVPTSAVATAPRPPRSRLAAFGMFWYDFIIGDDWQIAAGVALAFVLTFVVSTFSSLAWIVTAVFVLALIPYGVLRADRDPNSRKLFASATEQ